MRTKDEILAKAWDDIQNPKYNEQAALWLKCREIEILIDIRDILNKYQLDQGRRYGEAFPNDE